MVDVGVRVGVQVGLADCGDSVRVAVKVIVIERVAVLVIVALTVELGVIVDVRVTVRDDVAVQVTVRVVLVVGVREGVKVALAVLVGRILIVGLRLRVTDGNGHPGGDRGRLLWYRPQCRLSARRGSPVRIKQEMDGDADGDTDADGEGDGDGDGLTKEQTTCTGTLLMRADPWPS
jgi:hypothetical protein